ARRRRNDGALGARIHPARKGLYRGARPPGSRQRAVPRADGERYRHRSADRAHLRARRGGREAPPQGRRGMTLVLEKPAQKYMPSFLEALREGPFTHMALGGFGNTTAEEAARDPQAYLDKLTSPAPRDVATPNGKVFTLKDHEIFW